MSEESLYPTRREKSLYENKHAKIEKYHTITSSSIVLFRKTYSLLILIYMLLLVISGFEILANLMANSPLVRARNVPVGVVLLIAILISISALMHNQILLILGHGYKEKSAQLVVDEITPLSDCYVSLKLIRTMYGLAIVMPVIMIFVLWWLAGPESITEQINIQMIGLRSLWDAINASGDLKVADNAYKYIKWYLLAVTGGLGLALFMAVSGWLLATIARSRI